MTEGRQAHGWLHKSGGGVETLVIIFHGHNSNGDRSRFITLAKWFEHTQIDCLRWNAQREHIQADTWRVTTVSEEYEQVNALVSSLRSKYKRIIAIGHSQGALLALKLCAEGIAQTYIALMGVCDTIESLERKKQTIGIQTTSGQECTTVTLPNGVVFGYPENFFTDFTTWNVRDLLGRHHGASLFVSASRDKLVPPSEVEQAFAIAHEPKQLLSIDDEHNFSDENARVIAHAIRDWLRKLEDYDKL